MLRWLCTVCGYIYDPDRGDLESEVEPGTYFEDLPGEWICPECGAGRGEFEPLEE